MAPWIGIGYTLGPLLTVAVMHLRKPFLGESSWTLVSVDGEQFFPVTNRPTLGDEDAVRALIELDTAPAVPARMLDPAEWPNGEIEYTEIDYLGR